LFIDNGGAAAPLDPNTIYFYRVRPAGAAAWTTAGLASPGGRFESNWGFTVPRFDDARMVTLNGYASTTAEGTLELVHNQNDSTGTAFFNRAVAVDQRFQASFDFRISRSSGADGMAFVLYNTAAP